MGKRYWSELEILADTYEWARQLDQALIPPLADSYRRLPLLAVGSGGSFTSAVLAAYLHRLSTGRLSTATTPLEIVHSPFSLAQSAVLFLTASGGNPDILGGFQKTAIREPSELGILCLKKGSKLARAANDFSRIGKYEFAMPAGKDGFLATNSLVATAVILARAYSKDRLLCDLSIEQVAYQGRAESDYAKWLESKTAKLWKKQTLVVMYGPSCHAAAVDLESKFTEAALGHIQLADYRNFAHGRHHWLARHGNDTAVLAFVTDDIRPVAEKTLALVPKKIPQLQIDLGTAGAASAVGGIINALHLVGLKGKSQDFDPGRPHVPDFGRKIYHLKAFPKTRQKKSESSPKFSAAVNRKCCVTTVERSSVESECKEFSEKIQAAKFGALICDYDGTVCGADERLTHPRKEVVDRLNELLKAGVAVGFASGRGTSLRRSLQGQIKKRYWERVLLGYYNGGDIANLASNNNPDNKEKAGRDLSAIAKEIAQATDLSKIVEVDVRDKQISIIPISKADSDFCYQRVNELVACQSKKGLKVFRSGHSVDVVAPSVSKRSVVRQIEKDIGDVELKCLCVGDRGRWPGNDSELLMEPYSISVDEVSSSLDTCWNLASPGLSNVDAFLELLRAVKIKKSHFILDGLEVTE